VVTSGVFWSVVAAAFVVYWLTPERFRTWVLLGISAVYLGSLDLASVGALTAFATAFYLLAPRFVGRDRASGLGRAALILAALGYLGWHKYIPPLLAYFTTNEVSRHLLLPLGISYFTFKLIHFAIEVGRGHLKDRSPLTFALYMFLFPIFTAGPIERYDHFLKARDAALTSVAVRDGLTRIVHGLVKKFAIAEATLLPMMGFPWVKGELLVFYPELCRPSWAWFHLGLMFIYAYLDFSAYSDIAIGISRLFGFKIQENFNWPIFAHNISEFWKRWHMTLSGWCQAYVYLPTIGLTRNPYLAVILTFGAIGLWHAGRLPWLCWGLYHALGVILFLTWTRYKRKKKWFFLNKPRFRPIGIAITMLWVISSYAFPLADTHGGGVLDAIGVLGLMLGVH
jgi:alginate O-acetyltransferase complex protein AlgI